MDQSLIEGNGKMKLSQLNEARYSGTGGKEPVETRYVLYDKKAKKFIQLNFVSQSGVSRRFSFAKADITWFQSYKQAEEAMQNLWGRISKKRYKEGDEYHQRGQYRFEDRKIILTAKQAVSKNRMMDKRRAELQAIVIATVTATI